ncbi:hypothetical protein ACLQ2Q_15780 [Microbacterium sp. DT81.1]|uniref:hypothetical protein n=1 Tax=Microbacterium sp. DT81.1 TaxID=3393413 RepID=UPI003CEA0C94
MITDSLIVEFHSPGPMKIQELVTFYLRAVERFRAHAMDFATGGDQLSNQSRARGALAEALNWADTIDQYLREGPRDTIGTDRDPEWASKVEGSGGDLVLAFQFVRNHVHHQWLNLVATRTYSGADVSPSEWLWATAPARTRSGATTSDGAGAYERQMRGATVLTTLDRLGQVFWTKRRWEIHMSDVAQPGYPVRADLTFDIERS